MKGWLIAGAVVWGLATAWLVRAYIRAAFPKFPPWYPTVDVAILRTVSGAHGSVREVLVGQKESERPYYRFIGGFLSTDDVSVESAARRELLEEAGVRAGVLSVVGVYRVPEPRYPGTHILTTLFAGERMPLLAGEPKASDDISDVRWLSMERLMEQLVPAHQQLGVALHRHLEMIDNGLYHR